MKSSTASASSRTSRTTTSKSASRPARSNVLDISDCLARLGSHRSIDWSSPTHLHPRLSKRIVEVGDCWEWIGNYSNGGKLPAMRLNYKMVGVRRVLHTLKTERPLGSNRIMLTCGNFRCVNPEHYRVMSYTYYLRVVQQKGNEANRKKPYTPNPGNVKRRKLTPEQVAYIRASSESNRALAAKLGVSTMAVQNVRKGKTYKEYGLGIFSQLLRRAA